MASLGFVNAEVQLPRPTRVKNKTTAPIQITAEQILREARESLSVHIANPKRKIVDATEFADYQLLKRARNSKTKSAARGRSVWERELEVDYRNPTLWVRYAEFEMRNGCINHARNVWDRAVALLPQVDQLWYKYVHMEEMIGNVAGARQVFENWMDWMPDQQGWLSYVKYELRYNEVERARSVLERMVGWHSDKAGPWILYAKFEVKNGEMARARNCFERAVEKVADEEEAEKLFVAFAEFEEKCKETERARCIFKFALERSPAGGEDGNTV